MKIYDPKEKARAFNMYLDGMKMRNISIELGVPYGTIHSWHSRQKWADKRRHIETRFITESADLFGKTARLAITEGVFRIAKKTQDILDLIDSGIQRASLTHNSRDLLTLAKTLEKHYTLFQKMMQDVE